MENQAVISTKSTLSVRNSVIKSFNTLLSGNNVTVNDVTISRYLDKDSNYLTF